MDYHSAFKGRNPAIYYSMDEPKGCCAKWNEPIIEGQILYDATYMRKFK